MSATTAYTRCLQLLWLIFLPAFLATHAARAETVLHADRTELAVGASTTIHLEGNARWLKARWEAEPEGRVRFDSAKNTKAVITALEPGPVTIVAKVLTRSYRLNLRIVAPVPLAERPGGLARIEGLARSLGLPDTRARIARMLAEVKAGTRTPQAFYADLADLGATLFDVMKVRSTLVDGAPDLARQVLGETHAAGGTPVEETLLVWRRKQTLAAIDDVVQRFRKAGRVPADGNALIISHVGKWAGQEPQALTFTGDIDFSFVSNDVALAEAMKAAYGAEIKKRTGLDSIALDSVATAHGKAGLEVYIGRHGMAFAEEQMKINHLVDMDTGTTREVPLEDVARTLAFERELAEARGQKPLRPAVDTEPGLSMEMVRHFEHDIVKPKLFDMANAVIKAAKYLDRSYKSLEKSRGQPGDPKLAAFAEKITAWANAKPITPDIRNKMLSHISAYLDSPPRVIFDQDSHKLVLALSPERIATFHRQAATAMWDTVVQGSGKRTLEMETRMRELDELRRRGVDVDEDVAALRRDMVALVDMVEAEVMALHGEPVPQPVLDNNARVRTLLERLASHYSARTLSAEELTDKRWVEEMLKAQGMHPTETRLRMVAAYIMDRTARAAELSMAGVETSNRLLDIIDDRLLGPLRGEADFAAFEAEMKQVRQAELDPHLHAEAKGRLAAVKTRVGGYIQATNQYLNEGLQSSAAGRQGMRFMLVYGLIDEMKSYRDAWAREGWGGFATEMFRRRIPFGSAVENTIMGNGLRACWDVVTTVVPPLGLPEAAAGVITSLGEQLEAGYWSEELALFVDTLHDGAGFRLEQVDSYDGAKVGRYRLVSVTYRGEAIDLAHFAAMRNEQLAGLRRQIGRGHLDWTAYHREFQGLTHWLEVDRTLEKNLAAADPVLALLEEMAQHTAVGVRLKERLLDKYTVRWEEVKLGFIISLIQRLEDRRQAEQALGAGQMAKLYEELRQIAVELGIEAEMLASLDAEVGTNRLKQLVDWLWQGKRFTLDQAPSQPEVERASEVVLRYLESYTEIRKERAKVLDLLSEDARADGPYRYLTGPLFLSGRPEADKSAVMAWSQYVRECWEVAVADVTAVKREILGRDDLAGDDRDYAVRYAVETLWIKPYRQSGLAGDDADLNARANEHGRARQVVLKEYRDWLLSLPVRLTVNLGAPSAGPDALAAALAELQSSEAGADPVVGMGRDGVRRFQAPAGRYRLTVKAPGFEDYSEEVVLDRRQGDTTRTVRLTARPVAVPGRTGTPETPETPETPTGTPPGDPDAPLFVLDRVEFAKAGGSADLCGDVPTCMHYRRVASGLEIEDRNEISQGKASYVFKVTRQSNGNVESDYGVEIGFASPPASIRAGQKITLKASGSTRGYTTGWFLERGFTYYVERYDRKDYEKKTMVTFQNRERPAVDGRQQGAPPKSRVTEIVVPREARKEVVIGGRFGWDPPLFVIWRYKEQPRPLSAFPAPAKGEYRCKGGWGRVVVTDSAPGHARVTYTETYDKSAPGWIDLGVQDGKWQGTWGEDKVGRKGAFQYLKVSAEGFAGRWYVLKDSPGSSAGRRLPRASGRLECTLKGPVE